jgi:hypothetical protein
MKKFVSLKVSNLTLDHLAGLCGESVIAATPIVSELELELLQAALTRLNTDSITFKSLLDHSHKSLLTPEIRALDKTCGESFGGLKRGIAYYKKSSDPDKATAAKLLLTVFKPVWSLTSKPLASQLVMLDTLEERIAPPGAMVDALHALGLMDTWDVLMPAFHALQQVYQQRLSDNAAAALPAASNMKATVVKDYDGLCMIIEQALALLPSPELEKLYHELNELRAKYIRHLPKDLAAGEHCVIEPIDTQQYTGKAVTVIPKAHWREEGKPAVELVFAKDFSVTYRNNVKAGTAAVIIHGKGAYKGQKTATFNIAQ